MSEFNRVLNLFEKFYSDKKYSKHLVTQNQLSEKENIQRRSKAIADILENYRDQQSARNGYKDKVKVVFVPLFCSIAGLLILLMVTAVILSFIYLKDDQSEFLTVIIGSLVTGFSSVVSILLIITHYVFPKDEEKNFNDLISIIVANDTKRLEQIAHEKESKTNPENILDNTSDNKNDKKD